MSVFADIFADMCFPTLAEFNAQTIRYQDPQSDPVTIQGIVSNESILPEDTIDGAIRRRRRTVSISTDPDSVEGGVADPWTRGGEIELEIDSEEWWSVIEAESIGNGVARLVIQREPRTEKSRATARR